MGAVLVHVGRDLSHCQRLHKYPFRPMDSPGERRSDLVSTGFGIGVGILAIIVGALAISRKAYPLALIGSIASMFPGLGVIPGTLSLIYTGLSRNEFHLNNRR
jgi:uncharacterized oligopeptide transporter (OPT) family protein